jgi:hypothetical protein
LRQLADALDRVIEVHLIRNAARLKDQARELAYQVTRCDAATNTKF